LWRRLGIWLCLISRGEWKKRLGVGWRWSEVGGVIMCWHLEWINGVL
jgi:hypothetical protein